MSTRDRRAARSPWSLQRSLAAPGCIFGNPSLSVIARQGHRRATITPPAADTPLARRSLYAALALLLLAMVFGVWGVWKVFSDADGDRPTAAQLQAQQKKIDELEQRSATLARSDQISRDANGDLQGTLAERDEEIAGLRADVAFYERFVGATAPRRGLAVHECSCSAERPVHGHR